MAAYIRSVVRDCGLTCTSSCPDGDCFQAPVFNPRSKRSATLTRQEADEAFALLLSMVNKLSAEVESLKQELNPALTVDPAPTVDVAASTEGNKEEKEPTKGTTVVK